MKKFRYIFFFLFSLYAAGLRSQGAFKVSGMIKEEVSGQSVAYASVGVFSTLDSTAVAGGSSGEKGWFSISVPRSGEYYVKVEVLTFQSFKSEVFTLNEGRPEMRLFGIRLKPAPTELKEVTIETVQERTKQSGDTVHYNANAFKTNPDANAEDLITKMPGITSTNGTVKVNGEEVKQIFVDGKPFFGDDPAVALKNLPAEVIDKISVYDKASDQAQLTGFDDGKANKTINIKTKPGRNNGKFGKVYAGYGTDERYIAGGNLNIFKGDRRISVLELSNNINQQNFNMQDLLGVSGSGGSGGQGRGGQGGKGGMGGGMVYGGSGGAGNNFLVGQQGGISETHAAGLNYSDAWGTKVKVSGSYFFNLTNNANSSVSHRNYIIGNQNGLKYDQESISQSSNYNHRANLRLEYTIDTLNSIVLSPRFNVQQNNSGSKLTGINTLGDTLVQSKTENDNVNSASGYTFSNSLVLRHKFLKAGRTISLDGSTDLNTKNGTGSLYSTSEFHGFTDSSLIDQRSTQYTNGFTQSGNLVYTEPLSKKEQLQFNYNLSYTQNHTDKRTNDLDAYDNNYSRLDTLLSNKFDNTYITHAAGAGYRYNGSKATFNVTLNAQQAQLKGQQSYPASFTVEKNFQNLLPQLVYNYKFSDSKNIRINYRTSTTSPSITQLQNVINNSNPLLLSTGNPNLKQSYDHNISIRYGNSNQAKAKSMFIFLNGTYTQNYIGNSTLIPVNDTTVSSSLTLTRGMQLSAPVNLKGYWNARTFVTFSFPVKKIRSNFNLNTGLTYNSTPAQINNAINLASNYNFSQGVVLSSNISEKLDFTISYNANYSIVKNTLQTQSNNNYFNQVSSLKLNWMPWKGLVFSTNMTHTVYTGLSASYNLGFLLMNNSVGYKFLKNRSLEVKANVFDMLAQNNSISRTVTETYIEDIQTKVLTRYYMLMLTYTFRKFAGPPKTAAPQ
ncbi:MAG: outer membrane beta-barrel protein [Bacteroidia bacterium]